MSYLFNVCIIKPIVKDAEANQNEIINLKPITIADTVANIFENQLSRKSFRRRTFWFFYFLHFLQAFFRNSQFEISIHQSPITFNLLIDFY
jgi:hypothetical protein